MKGKANGNRNLSYIESTQQDWNGMCGWAVKRYWRKRRMMFLVAWATEEGKFAVAFALTQLVYLNWQTPVSPVLC